MEITIVIILLVVGIVFLLLEIFLLPGISIAGIAGVASLIIAIVYAYLVIGATAGHLTLIGAILFLAFAVWWFMKSRVLEKMSLTTDIDGKVEPLKDVHIEVGDEGVSMSRLAPMGKVKINDYVVEAKVNDDFIDEGEKVIVLQIDNNNVLVEKSKV